MTLKIAVIGSPDYYDFFVDNLPDWDWQTPSATIDEFYDKLDSGEIDGTTPMLIVDPALYDPTGTDSTFESFLASMAPYCLIAVIAFNESDDTTPKDEIESKVASYAEYQGSHIYWLDADDILRSMDEVIEDYVNNGDSAKDVVEIFINELGITPPEEAAGDVADGNRRDDDYSDASYESEDDEDEDNTFTNTLGRRGTIITVTSAKGGSGKSTVAFSLAQEIGKSTREAVRQGRMKKPLKVVLVDGDIYDGQLCYVLGASKPTMINIAQEPHINKESVGRNLVTNDIVQTSKRQQGDFISFDALLAPKSPRYVEDTPPDMWRRVINILATMYDIVILDTSVMYFLDPVIYDVMYPVADKILYVTDLDLKSILDTTKWMQNVCAPESASGFGIPLEKVGIVINKGMKEVGMGPRKITKILQVATHQIYQLIDKTIPVDELPVPHVLTTVPSYPKLITGASNNQNLGAILTQPPLEKSFFILAQAVVPSEIARRLVSTTSQQ